MWWNFNLILVLIINGLVFQPVWLVCYKLKQTIIITLYYGVLALLTLACVGRGEVTIIIVLVCPLAPVNLWTLALWKYYQQTSNHTIIKSNNRLLLKAFRFKVMTIFVTDGCCFTTLRRHLVAKEFTEHTWSIAFESQLELKYK